MLEFINTIFSKDEKMIPFQKTSTYTLSARWESQRNYEQTTKFIFENACYPDLIVPFASILPGYKRVYFEIRKNDGSNSLGFHQLIKDTGSFESDVQNHLDNHMDQIRKKSWWNKFQ